MNDRMQFPRERELDKHEAEHMTRTLKRAGYIVLRPEEIDLPATVQAERCGDGYPPMVAVRVDTQIDGKRLYAGEVVEIELLVSADFRHHVLRRLCDRLTDTIGRDLQPKIEAVLEPALKCFVPEPSMSLADVKRAIEEA